MTKSLVIPDQLFKELTEEAKKLNIPLSNLINFVLSEWLNKRKSQNEIVNHGF